MKKIFLLLIGAMMISAVSAQVLEQGEAALVYYSPKTAFNLEFTYMVETQERGIYAAYAKDLLGVTDVVKETATRCELKDVRIVATSSTDYTRAHKVSAESGIPMLLTINDKGLLTGYNVPFESKRQEPRKPESKKDCPHHDHPHPAPVPAAPVPEEVMKAANPLAQANEVAKQIFHLRETRMYLLNGEVEHAPADGRSMELVLEELAAQERALTELFVGKKHVRKEHKRLMVEPSDAGQLLFFSEENGFTDADNVDADTIVVRMFCQQQTVHHANPKAKKSELSQIVYNIPGHCAVSVVYKGRTLASRELPVAQLGVDVALPKSWFTGKELPKIVFSEKTGNIVSVSK